jgi:hypothetical protein
MPLCKILDQNAPIFLVGLLPPSFLPPPLSLYVAELKLLCSPKLFVMKESLICHKQSVLIVKLEEI